MNRMKIAAGLAVAAIAAGIAATATLESPVQSIVYMFISCMLLVASRWLEYENSRAEEIAQKQRRERKRVQVVLQRERAELERVARAETIARDFAVWYATRASRKGKEYDQN